jgi:hypothetical protein
MVSSVARDVFSPQEQEFGWSNESQTIQAEALSRLGNSGSMSKHTTQRCVLNE